VKMWGCNDVIVWRCDDVMMLGCDGGGKDIVLCECGESGEQLNVSLRFALSWANRLIF